MSTKTQKNDRIFYMHQEIVDKLSITKNDCDKFIHVVDFFHKHKKKSASFGEHGYFRVPNFLPNYGITIFDIEKFSEIFGVHIRKQEDLSFFDNPGDDLFFRVSGFDPEVLKLQIQELKEGIQEKSGLITLYLEQNSLRRDCKNQTLACTFGEGAPYTILANLIRSKSPKKRSELGQESKNWPRTIKEINNRTRDKLLLKEHEPLIINDKGYHINRERYHIVYKN